jgi:uncharacterized protein YbaA (DUF1428 family)
MPYVDGFIVAVPKKNLEAYRSLAKRAGKVWREHGALEYREWVDAKRMIFGGFESLVKA